VNKMDKTEFSNYLLLGKERIPNRFFYVFLMGHISNALVIIQRLEQGKEVNEQELTELKILYDIFKNRKLLHDRFDFQSIEKFSKGYDIDQDFINIIEHIIKNKKIDIKPEQFVSLRDYLLFVSEKIYNEDYPREERLNAISIS